MKIFLVDQDDCTAIDVEVDPNVSVGGLKYEYLTLREQEKPMQTVLFTFKRKLLEDNQTLGDYNIQPSSAIMVEYVTVLQSEANLPGRKLKIHVRSSTGEMNLLAHADTKVIEVKEEIYRAQEVPLRRQRLISSGMTLEDHRTLRECGIREGSVIYLVLYLLGS